MACGVPPNADGLFITVLDGLAEGGELLVEAIEGGEQRRAVLAKDCGPERAVGSGDAGAVAIRACGKLKRSGGDGRS